MMKRFLGLALAMTMLLSVAPAMASDTANGQPVGTVTGTVTVYDGAWNDAKAIGTLDVGTGVIIMQQNQQGGRIQVFARVQRLAGWVDAQYIRIDSSTPVFPAVVISQNVSLRETASTGAARLASIPNGSVLEVMSEEGSWYYVRYWDGKSETPMMGYVRSDFVVRDPSFVTTTQSTYVYSTPSRSSKKVGQLVSGTQLVVIGEYNDFWVVNLRSASGFIYKNDIDYDQISGGNG